MIPKIQGWYSRLKDMFAVAGIRPAEYYCSNHLNKNLLERLKSFTRLGNWI